MTVVVSVKFPLTPAQIQKFEAENMHLHGPIMEAAMKYITGHRRLLADDHVLDLDEYRSVEDYHAFFEVAKPMIDSYAELAGAPIIDTVYVEDETPMPGAPAAE
ncbi:MAG TPA: hypothetical protein VNT53_06610 [Pseudolysinimonas sp.]|nr:hypothetical protein [Pseudolysinimonas sp.]